MSTTTISATEAKSNTLAPHFSPDMLSATATKPSCGKKICCEKCKAKKKKVLLEAAKLEAAKIDEATIQTPEVPATPERKLYCWKGLFKGTLDF